MTAIRAIGWMFLFLRAVVAEVVVAEVIVRRHFLQALDANVLAGALFEGLVGHEEKFIPSEARDHLSTSDARAS
jgi:hypothetical protein